jgi:FkbM family methyltransferase
VLRHIIRELFPPVLVKAIRYCLPRRVRSAESGQEEELARLRALPPGQPTVTNIFGWPFHVVDGGSFAYLYYLYFRQQSYNFVPHTDRPFIIDCGANVGVSVTRWKTSYPNAQVLAFEADPQIFQVLQRNCGHLSGVRLVHAAVWDREGEIPFLAKGGEGGHIAEFSNNGGKDICCSVPCVRLRSFLTQKYDLLKMDIEGAEVAVIQDCADALENVARIFIEHHSFIHRKQVLGETLSLLENAGYRIHVHTKVRSPRPFDEVHVLNEKDLHLDLFCFRGEVQPRHVTEGF